MGKYDETKIRWERGREMIHEAEYTEGLRTSLWLDHRSEAGTAIYKLWERRNTAPGWSNIELLDAQMDALIARLKSA